MFTLAFHPVFDFSLRRSSFSIQHCRPFSPLGKSFPFFFLLDVVRLHLPLGVPHLMSRRNTYFFSYFVGKGTKEMMAKHGGKRVEKKKGNTGRRASPRKGASTRRRTKIFSGAGLFLSLFFLFVRFTKKSFFLFLFLFASALFLYSSLTSLFTVPFPHFEAGRKKGAKPNARNTHGSLFLCVSVFNFFPFPLFPPFLLHFVTSCFSCAMRARPGTRLKARLDRPISVQGWQFSCGGAAAFSLWLFKGQEHWVHNKVGTKLLAFVLPSLLSRFTNLQVLRLFLVFLFFLWCWSSFRDLSNVVKKRWGNVQLNRFCNVGLLWWWLQRSLVSFVLRHCTRGRWVLCSSFNR